MKESLFQHMPEDVSPGPWFTTAADAASDVWEPYTQELVAKMQFLIDWIHEKGLLDDGDNDPAFCFPDGDIWRPSE